MPWEGLSPAGWVRDTLDSGNDSAWRQRCLDSGLLHCSLSLSGVGVATDFRESWVSDSCGVLSINGGTRLGVMAHAVNPSTREAEAAESLCIQGQPGLYSEFLDS